MTSREVIEVKKSKTRRAPIKFNKICFSRREGVAASWSCHAHFQGAKLKPRSRAFCWCIVCFCISNGSFRKLEKTKGVFFFKFHHFYEIAEIIFFQKFSSSFFQYSERTIASTETNYTSAESPVSQLKFGTLKVGVAWSGSRHTPSPRKT